MKKKKIITIILAIALAVSIFLFSSPTRAIRIGALKQGCEWHEVMNAKFEKTNDKNPNSWGDMYISDSSLCDKLTGSGHSVWYVYRILFINIPVWAGNA